jgi:hypothetical protein
MAQFAPGFVVYFITSGVAMFNGWSVILAKRMSTNGASLFLSIIWITCGACGWTNADAIAKLPLLILRHVSRQTYTHTYIQANRMISFIIIVLSSGASI